MEFEVEQLHNGIRIAHRRVKSPVAHCCIMVNAGTRDERDEEHGLAHFIEHVLFKGTKKRKAFHIMSRLEDVGGELNAYTTKEETVVHATVLKPDFSRAMELLADIVFHSNFPGKEIAKEKEVVVDEINSYKDSPSELIYDDFEELLYPNHPFGRNILGTEQGIRRFTKKSIASFIERTYSTDQMVFCSIGDIPHTRIKRMAEKYLGSVPSRIRKEKRTPIGNYSVYNRTIELSTHQTHCIVGTAAYSLKNEKRIAMHLLNNILGGPGMNSRLNLMLREKFGYAYSVESSYIPYTDTGIFTIYFGTDKENIAKALELTHHELQRIREKRLGILQLSKAKKQLIGQLAIAAESNENFMLSAAKSFLVYDKPESLDALFKKINTITSGQILEVANEILHPERLSTLIYR